MSKCFSTWFYFPGSYSFIHCSKYNYSEIKPGGKNKKKHIMGYITHIQLYSILIYTLDF